MSDRILLNVGRHISWLVSVKREDLEQYLPDRVDLSDDDAVRAYLDEHSNETEGAGWAIDAALEAADIMPAEAWTFIGDQEPYPALYPMAEVHEVEL